MQKTIEIDGKKVEMRASALVPRLYRFRFGRDIIQDMSKLKRAFDKANELNENSTEAEKIEKQLSVMDLLVFENVAYIMAKHANNNIPDSPDEWLEEFEMFSIYEVLPTMLQLWNLSNGQTSKSKKK